MNEFLRKLVVILVIVMTIFCVQQLFGYYNFAGQYNSLLNVIYLYPKDYAPLFVHYSASHEIGHFIYYKNLNDEQRREYDRIFKDTNEWVDDYARTNPSEDFAETYARGTVCNFNMNRIPDDRKQVFEQSVSMVIVDGNVIQ